MVAKGKQQPGVSRALFLLVKRCLLILQTTKRRKKKRRKKGEKKSKPNQHSADWEQNQAGVKAGAKTELQNDRGL